MSDQQQMDQQNDTDAFDPVAYGEEWLRGVFERMNFDIEVEGKRDGDRFYFDATGEDAEYLLGVGTSAPKSIEAIQTLLGAALSRNGEEGQVFLDVRGWREKRAGSLEDVATELRDVATRLGRSVKIAGLNSYERSVVHQALAEDDSVRTESQDQGIFRKLVIFPGR